MVTFLAYGAIGLGLALAILSFKLLRIEQTLPEPRPSVFRAIYAFMLMTVVLTALGFISEYLDRSKELWRLLDNMSQLNDTIDGMKKYANKLETVLKGFDKMKYGIEILTSIKGDKLSRMDAKDFETNIKSIKEELISINEAMKKQLNLKSSE
jgi:hypothetical protein